MQSVKQENLVPLHSRLRGHGEQNSMIELLRDRDNEMSLGFLACGRFREINWSRC